MAPKQNPAPATKLGKSKSRPNPITMLKTQDRKDSRAEGELESPQATGRPTPGEDSNGHDIEGTIVTDGARSISRAIKNQQMVVNSFTGDDDLEVLEESQAVEPKRHVGFPPPEELPRWFPNNIKAIYRVDRHGGALSFKELNAITRYRALVDIVRRRRWKQYLKAGEARWMLQQVLRRLKAQPWTKAFYEYRKKQFDMWKENALRTWKKLEKIHRGALILDETININFRQERMIYARNL